MTYFQKYIYNLTLLKVFLIKWINELWKQESDIETEHEGKWHSDDREHKDLLIEKMPTTEEGSYIAGANLCPGGKVESEWKILGLGSIITAYYLRNP